MNIIVRPIAFHLRLLAASLTIALFPIAGEAQNFVVWTTNYYSVTGASFREIRQSIAESRPWKDGFDGDTRWNVEWKFSLAEAASGCSCTSFSTTTKITTTLPRWQPPSDVLPPVKEQWTRYFTNLAQHEAGHARIGLAAATEVGKGISQTGAQPDCDQLKRTINERAGKVVDDYRAREKEYDRRTAHGTKSPDAP
jgi:predicted secreted Zn-dependent protease